MVRLGKIASLIIVAWVIYGALLYLDTRVALSLQVTFFPAFYGVALVLGSLAALWDEDSPVLSSFAVGFFSVFQWGYLMALWQTTKGFFAYGSFVPGTTIFLVPLSFALITGAIAATAGFVLYLLRNVLRGGILIPSVGSWRSASKLGARLGFIAGAWVLLSVPLFLSQTSMGTSGLNSQAVLFVTAVCSVGILVGAGLAIKGRNVVGGILLMGWGAFLSAVSLPVLPFLPVSTLMGTAPGLLAIAAGVRLYYGTRLLGRTAVSPR